MKKARLNSDIGEVLTDFVAVIDVGAAMAYSAVREQSGSQTRGGSSYDDLRQVRGPLREIMDGWPTLFAGAYCTSGPVLEPEQPIEFNAGLLISWHIVEGDAIYGDLEAPSARMMEVLRRIRGLHTTEIDEFCVVDGVEMAAGLDPRWLPAAGKDGAEALAEWSALVLVATRLRSAAEDQGRKSYDLVEERPSSWRSYLGEMIAVPRPGR
jgi:hypothetical protein